MKEKSTTNKSSTFRYWTCVRFSLNKTREIYVVCLKMLLGRVLVQQSVNGGGELRKPICYVVRTRNSDSEKKKNLYRNVLLTLKWCWSRRVWESYPAGWIFFFLFCSRRDYWTRKAAAYLRQSLSCGPLGMTTWNASAIRLLLFSALH